MKFKKLLAFTPLAALCLSSFLTFSVSAAGKSSFTPNETNFKPVFDFDSVPSAYTDGYKPGTRTDTIGDSKSEKSITGEGLGLTYDLTIDASNSYKGNALRLDVTQLAPPDGAWCPVMLNVRYGKNKLVDATGATDFIFWVDTTKYKNTNGEHIQKGINLYIQEADVLPDGSITSDATAWKPKAGKNGGYYLMEDGNGGWTKVENSEYDFWLPTNYVGWIKIPLSTFEHTEWNVNDSDGKFNCKQIQIIHLGMGNYSIQSGATIYFDEFGFVGNFSKSDTKTTAKQGGATTNTTNKNDAGTAKTTNNGTAAGTDSAVTTTTNESQPNDSVTSDVDTSNSATGTTNTDNVGDTDNKADNGGLWWLWIIIAVVVVGGGAGGCLFYIKKVKPAKGE